MQQLYSRYKDGCDSVTQLDNGQGWLLQGNQYPTAKSLLAVLTGHPYGRHWSIRRYFRLPTAAAPQHKPQIDVFDVLAEAAASRQHQQVRDISIASVAAAAPRHSEHPRQHGIDLLHRSDEVRKLLYAGFGRRMYMSGYDPEDVLQEVFKGLLIRNAGTCPYDRTKSSFGHYVHMVCSCVLSNYHRKQYRVQAMEQVGLGSPTVGNEHPMDVASNVTVPARTTLAQEDCLVLEEADDLLGFLRGLPKCTDNHLAVQLLPLLIQGMPRDHILQALHIPPVTLSRVLGYLRKQTTAWQCKLPIVSIVV